MKKRLIEKWIVFLYTTKAGLNYMKVQSWLGLKMLRIARELLKRGFGHCSVCGAKNNMDQSAGIHGTRCMKPPKPCWENNVFED